MAPVPPSWRGAGQPERGGVRSWRRPPAEKQELSVGSHWLRSLLGTVSAVLGLGAIILFIVLVNVPGCTRTTGAVFVVGPYHDAGMPPEPFARQDAEAIQGCVPQAQVLPPRFWEGNPEAGASRRTPSASGNPGLLVVYVAALAGRSPQGLVLYSADATPDEADGQIPMTRLQEFLERRPAAQKKVLILDLSRGPVDWRWGQFAVPSTAHGDEQHEAPSDWQTLLTAVPNLAVVSATAPGERSWMNPAVGQSVFAHYLTRGLRGEADGNRDRRVTLRELYHFVLTRTHHWVTQNRDARGQHPQLLLPSRDSEALLGAVISESVESKARAASVSPVASDPDMTRRLEGLWEARDKWRAEHPEQWDPIGWRAFQEHVHRAEQWRLEGQPAGMEPHLQAAQAALQDLEAGSGRRQPDVAEFAFVAAGLARRQGSPTPAGVDPPAPEQQLQVVLQRYAPPGSDVAAQKESLRTRGQSEALAWHGYRARLWTDPLWNDADRRRRRAEDLLFVGGPAEADAARERRDGQPQWQQVEQITRELTDAVVWHQRLLAELPDLAFWAAQRIPVEELGTTASKTRRRSLTQTYSEGIDEARFRPPSFEEQQKLRDELDDSQLQQLEIELLLLFEQSRRLANLIDRELEPSPTVFADANWLAEWAAIRQRLTDARSGCDAVQRRLELHARGLLGGEEASARSGRTSSSQVQHAHWLRLRNALQWSGLSKETRQALFADLEHSARTLHANADDTPGATPPEWSDADDWSGVDGCWQALWALQTLSLGASDAEMHARWVIWKNAVVDPRKQIDLLTDLGQQVRVELRRRADRAMVNAEAAESLPQGCRTLLGAERAARTLHGYDAALFSRDRDPVRQLREFDLGALCLTQAARYLEDYWGKTDPRDREPWYAQAVAQCLRVADRQQDRAPCAAWKPARDDLARRLVAAQSARLKIRPLQGQLDLSLSSQGPLPVSIEWDDHAPQGVAAVWIEADPGVERVLEIAPATRRGVAGASQTAEFTVQKVGSVPSEGCTEIALRPQLLFRARQWGTRDDQALVNPCPPDAVEWLYTPPGPAGEIVVTGTDRRDTMFILDCSYSMSESMVPGANGESRFQSARRALSDALRVLRDGPVLRGEPPYVVGLMAYGHRAKARDGDPRKTETNPDWKPPIPDIVASDWRYDYEVLAPAEALTSQRSGVLDKNLEALGPFGQTPLLGAIRQAGRSLPRGGAIVAVTDGAFNDDVVDGNLYRQLEELFANRPDLALHLVAFGVGATQEIAALRRLTERTRGTFYEAPTGQKLAEAIARSMRPRTYSVTRDIPPVKTVSANLNEPVVDLAPQRYKVRFPGRAEVQVRILGGERLQFELDKDGQTLKLAHPVPRLFRNVTAPGSVPLNEPNRFGYVKASYDKTRHLAELLLCCDRDDLVGAIDRPAEISLRVTPRGTARRTSGALKLAPGQSVPVWSVTLRDWPIEAQPEIRAFWKPQRTEPDVLLPLVNVISEPRPVNLPGWPERALTMAAERQPGKILVRLRATGDGPASALDEIRLELGETSLVEQRFAPLDRVHRVKLFEKQHEVVHEFEVAEGFAIDRQKVALTSASALQRDARTLESPLVIEKWDEEQ